MTTVTATVSKAEVTEPPKPQIPPRPVMPPEATAFPKLQKVKATLDKHNNLIFEAEGERNQLEIERDDLKGLATVQDFYTAFYTAQRATDAYQKECTKWDETYGEKASSKAETMHEKIQRYKEKADRLNVFYMISLM